MDKQPITTSNPMIYYRLIALWVLNEAMLGGIIHGFKLPVSGLIVGSCAVICICLIAWYVPVKGAIIKATIIVAIFKMMLSPQAPPPAYIAVFFQGLMGELLFRKKGFFQLSCFLLAGLSLLESGLQRILVLTIIYGKDLWIVINDFINGLTKQKIATNYSLLIGITYLLVHLITGLLVGWLASVLPKRIEAWRIEGINKITITRNDPIAISPKTNRKKGLKRGLLIVWIILVILYVQSEFRIGTPLLPSHISLRILIRSLIIILAWIFIVGPLLKQLLHYWLQKKKTRSGKEIQEVIQLLPATQQLIVQCWRSSATKKGWKRVGAAAKLILVNSLATAPSSEENRDVYILTGQVQTGKTSSLVSWSEKRKDVFGILTPVVNNKRMFMDVQTRERFPMEAKEGETNVLSVGKFVFSKTSFDRAVEVIQKASHEEGWLIIDEVGPMELRGEGFAEIITKVLDLKSDNQNLLLIVREGLVQKVLDIFRIKDPVVIYNTSTLG